MNDSHVHCKAINSSIIYHPYIFLSVDGLEIKLKEVLIESHLLYTPVTKYQVLNFMSSRNQLNVCLLKELFHHCIITKYNLLVKVEHHWLYV